MTNGFCGIDCEHCKVYQAAMMPIGDLRSAAQEAIAAQWRASFKHDFKSESMVCFGCQSQQLCGYCSSCEIRRCGIEKQVTTCETCTDYPCQKVTEFRALAFSNASDHVFSF